MDPYLTLENVSINIPIYGVDKSFRSEFLSTCIGGKVNSQNNKVIIQALNNISLNLKPGDRLGLIGHNGAGKSTLLNVMAGIYKPVSGLINSHGKIASFFNLALGMDSADTGLENIRTIGLYLGMTPKEIAAKTEEIIHFTDLADFINLPVRTYSNGMLTRLTFGIATSLEPDILLIDESIGAGDQSFAAKAKQRLNEFYNKISIIVVATHSNELIRQICNKVALLEHGKIIKIGLVDDVLDNYCN